MTKDTNSSQQCRYQRRALLRGVWLDENEAESEKNLSLLLNHRHNFIIMGIPLTMNSIKSIANTIDAQDIYTTVVTIVLLMVFAMGVPMNMNRIKGILNVINLKDIYTTIRDYKSNIGRTDKLIMHLEINRRQMDDRVRRAEVPGKIRSSQAVKWLDDVETYTEKLKDIATEGKNLGCIGGYLPNFTAQYFLSKSAEAMNKTVEEYIRVNKVAEAELVCDAEPDSFEMVPGGGPAVGMDSVWEELKDCFEMDRISIIGVYGMGGVGKTLLLKKFNNEYLQQSDHHVIWIEVGDRYPEHPTVEDVQKIIMKRLGIRWERMDNKQDWKISICTCLSSKPFVMFLDDIWKPLNLREVGIPIPQPLSRSKIILSTQIESVCTKMRARKVLVECLTCGEADELFEETVGKEVIISDPDIKDCTALLLGRCRGLPLTIKTLGQALANQREPSGWMNTETSLKVAPEKIDGMEVEFLSRMRRSYNNLPNEQLQKCFLHCSLLPESIAVARESLVNHLLGEGIIQDDLFDFGHEAYNSGYNLLDDLKTAFLLKADEESDMICMHPMIRVLAIWIGNSEGKWLIRADCKLVEAPRGDKWKGAERISLAYNRITELSEIPQCPSLLTLLLRRNSLKKICDGFFEFMPQLRVLDLSNNPICELPASIAKLVNLRYLELRGTKIKSLPEELKELVELRILILKLTLNLKVLPKGIITKLTKLQVLEMDLSFGDWEVAPIGDHGANIDELNQLRHLMTLGITIEREDALKKLAQSPRLAASTRNLTLRCSDLRAISLVSLLKAHQHLRVLCILNCSDLEMVEIKSIGSGPMWSRLEGLRELYLIGLPKAIITWKDASLATIRKLFLCGCSKIEHLISVDDNDDEDHINIFPNLERLELRNMKNLKSLMCGSRMLALPHLVALKVLKCPKLTNIKIATEQKVKLMGSRSWLFWVELLNQQMFKSVFMPFSKDYSDLEGESLFKGEDELESDSEWELVRIMPASIRSGNWLA